MDQKEQARYAARAKVVKALAHPTRLYIVDRLARGEECVCKLTELVGADVSTVSKHLSVLRNAGIVSDERRGTQIFYTLKQPCVLSFLGCIEAVAADEARAQLSCLR